MDPRLVSLAKRLIHTASAHPLGTVVGAALPAGGERLAALTFDDGPDPEWTPRLLAVLEAHGARGTFFLVGKAAARHPELVQRLVAGGHALGNHTWDHPSLPLLRRRGRRAQIRWCGEALAPHLASQPGPRLFRPPYGHQTLASQLDALTLGYTVVTWSIVAEDWRDDPAEALVERVRRRLRPGAIVLFHDTLATTDDPRYRDRTPTLQAVETLVAEPGTRWVTVPELLRAGRPQRWPWYRRSDLAWLRRLV